jgi:hypothetical protein
MHIGQAPPFLLVFLDNIYIERIFLRGIQNVQTSRRSRIRGQL